MTKIGRNDPCPCGSGKKSKKCCEALQDADTGSPTKVLMGVAWYRPEQWERLREISEDRSELEDTYAEWLAMAERNLKKIPAQGVDIRKVFVNVDELEAWCLKTGRAVNAEARTTYTCEKLQEESEQSSQPASSN